MPVLPLEPYVLPEDLLSCPSQYNADSSWWVLHVRPRTEKALARELFRSEIAFFLPLCTRQLQSRGGRENSYVPLFPGYVFLFGDDNERVEALKTNKVIHTIPVVDQDKLQYDLKRVHHLMTTGEPMTPEGNLPLGTEVIIVRGPLEGLEGQVIRRGKQLRLVVEVQMLGQGVSAEIETWMVEPKKPE